MRHEDAPVLLLPAARHQLSQAADNRAEGSDAAAGTQPDAARMAEFLVGGEMDANRVF